MKSIFSAKLDARVRPNDILVTKTCKSATFGDKILARNGPKIWNALLQNIKETFMFCSIQINFLKDSRNPSVHLSPF